MHRQLLVALSVAALGMSSPLWASGSGKGVEVTPDPAHQRVNITVDGEPFTSYIWPSTLKKPTLYPLVAADGETLTRGFPLDPHPGERVDHPHHVGLWFNYGNVNGFDFWNNSDAIKPADRPKMGHIVQDKIVSTKSGAHEGELVVESTWITGKDEPVLREKTTYVFRSVKGVRSIDQITTLQALDHVVFRDDKEGMLGMRVARWLESPEDAGGTYLDASGRPTKVDAADTHVATGVYRTSENVSGPAVWGTRGAWCTLTGHTGKHVETIGIIDHPKNPGSPTYWHARGYGLFAANPLGRTIFDTKQPAFNYTLEKGQSATFRYRVLFFSRAATPEEMNQQAKSFAAE